MKIEGKPPIGLEDTIRQQLRKVSEKLRTSQVEQIHQLRSEGGEKITISQQARTLSELLAQAREIPEVRTELVQRLREAIASGTYDVSSQDVATKMILESLYELLGK